MSTIAIPPSLPVPMPGSARMTAEAFAERYSSEYVELVNGIVKERSVPGLNHGLICANVTISIGGFIQTQQLGRIMSNDSFVKTGAETVRGPDVVYYSYERLPREQAVPTKLHEVAPDLVVEVKSPSELWGELFSKIGEYLRVGIRVVVVLDPAKRTVSVYRGDDQAILQGDDVLTLPDVLPGFSVSVRRLFE